MKCPYCKYVNGWNHKTLELTEGQKGNFYQITNNIKMERERFMEKDVLYLVGCPKCRKVFLSP